MRLAFQSGFTPMCPEILLLPFRELHFRNPPCRWSSPTIRWARYCLQPRLPCACSPLKSPTDPSFESFSYSWRVDRDGKKLGYFPKFVRLLRVPFNVS